MALALAVGAAGALWVIFRGDLAALPRLLAGRGEAVFFAGCVAHALHAPMIRRLNRGEGVVAFSFGTFAGGAAVLVIVEWEALLAAPWLGLGAGVWAVILCLAVFANAVSLLPLQHAALRLPASKVMAYAYLVPSRVILWKLGLGQAAPAGVVTVGVVTVGVALTVAAPGLLLKGEEKD